MVKWSLVGWKYHQHSGPEVLLRVPSLMYFEISIAVTIYVLESLNGLIVRWSLAGVDISSVCLSLDSSG